MTETKMTNYLLIINDGPYGNERPYNALRLAMNLAKRPQTPVRGFFVGDGGRGVFLSHKTSRMNRSQQQERMVLLSAKGRRRAV